MKSLLLALVLLLASAGPALADPPNGPPVGPCAGPNPPWFCGPEWPDDQITVTDEPPGRQLPGRRHQGDRAAQAQAAPDRCLPAARAGARGARALLGVEEDENGRRPSPSPTGLLRLQRRAGCRGAPGPPGPAGPAGPRVRRVRPGAAGQPCAAKSATPRCACGVRLFLPPRLGRFGVVRLRDRQGQRPLRFNGIVRVRTPANGPAASSSCRSATATAAPTW